MEFVIQVSLTKNPESTTWNPELNHSIKFRMQDGRKAIVVVVVLLYFFYQF